MNRPVVVTIVAILDVLFGILMVLFGISFMALAGLLGYYGSDLIPELAEIPFLDLLAALGGMIGIVFIIIAAITFFLAWGLLRGKGWARILTIVFSMLWIALGLLSLPNPGLGMLAMMAINGLILYFFILRPEVKAFFSPAPAETYQPPATYQASQVTPPPPSPQGAAQIPACPKCGQPLTWIEQYQRWYCYNCQQYS